MVDVQGLTISPGMKNAAAEMHGFDKECCGTKKQDFEGTTRIEAAGNGARRDLGCISSNHVRINAFDDVYEESLLD